MLTNREIHQEIIERCRRGERRAQYELYKLYAKPMLNVSMRILNDRMEAEDVLQESFINAFSKLKSFRGESTFGAWIKRIVINRSLNVVKKRKFRFEDIEDENIRDEQEDEQVVEYNVNDIHRALGELPEGYRLVFTLYMFEDYSHQEIAEQLNISVNTSKSQLSRARSKMKNLMQIQKANEEG